MMSPLRSRRRFPPTVSMVICPPKWRRGDRVCEQRSAFELFNGDTDGGDGTIGLRYVLLLISRTRVAAEVVVVAGCRISKLSRDDRFERDGAVISAVHRGVAVIAEEEELVGRHFHLD
jgi:hypothetical protein